VGDVLGRVISKKETTCAVNLRCPPARCKKKTKKPQPRVERLGSAPTAPAISGTQARTSLRKTEEAILKLENELGYKENEETIPRNGVKCGRLESWRYG